jgi:hypothetical protein
VAGGWCSVWFVCVHRVPYVAHRVVGTARVVRGCAWCVECCVWNVCAHRESGAVHGVQGVSGVCGWLIVCAVVVRRDISGVGCGGLSV